MLEKEIYFDLAIRYLKASQEELEKETPKIEVSAFCVYYAYESIACATICHFNRAVPLRSHGSKLVTFFSIIRSKKNFKSLSAIINELNYKFLSLQNQTLYPQTIDGHNFNYPKDIFKKVAIEKLQKRVDGLIKKVEKIIGMFHL